MVLVSIAVALIIISACKLIGESIGDKIYDKFKDQ